MFLNILLLFFKTLYQNLVFLDKISVVYVNTTYKWQNIPIFKLGKLIRERNKNEEKILTDFNWDGKQAVAQWEIALKFRDSHLDNLKISNFSKPKQPLYSLKEFKAT
jgi:hypothetical protein